MALERFFLHFRMTLFFSSTPQNTIVIILPSSPGSILLSKHLTFLSPSPSLIFLYKKKTLTSSFFCCFFYCDLRSILLEERRKRKRNSKEYISCRKFMNKFKDAIYGERKKIVILNFFIIHQKKKTNERLNIEHCRWIKVREEKRHKFMNFNGSLASIDCL
jgi:uncharacterized membrane protein SirB2